MCTIVMARQALAQVEELELGKTADYWLMIDASSLLNSQEYILIVWLMV